MEPDDHILPGAFDKSEKTVPLVVYDKDGTRQVVGDATISIFEGGIGIEGHVTDPELMKMVSAATNMLDGFSIYKKDAKDGR